MGIDPTQWPLDVNVDYTRQMVERNPIEPDGKFTVYGDFCWGGEKDRAEVYFISAGTQPPATIGGTDIEAAKRTQQQLIASGLRGQASQSSDRDVVFTAPDKDTFLSGSGSSGTARFIVYDNKAKRASGVTATSILTMRAQPKSLPLLLIIGIAFGAVVVTLLLVIAFRGGKKRPTSPAPAPMVAGGAPYAPSGGYGPGTGVPPYAPAPYGGAGYGASPYGAPAPAAPNPAPPFGAPGPFASPAPAASPAAAGGDFMYGAPPGGAAAYGMTMAQPAPGSPAPDPYGGGAPAGSRAVLSGPGGTYSVTPGVEMKVGRDAAKCHIALAEPRVSGVHATLKMEGGQLYVRDENSNNGTFVDGHRLAPNMWTVAPAGGVLRFGPAEFSVRVE